MEIDISCRYKKLAIRYRYFNDVEGEEKEEGAGVVVVVAYNVVLMTSLNGAQGSAWRRRRGRGVLTHAGYKL